MLLQLEQQYPYLTPQEEEVERELQLMEELGSDYDDPEVWEEERDEPEELDYYAGLPERNRPYWK